MTPQRRMYVHVGCPKTGTTSLQSALWSDRDQLATQGLEMPLNGPGEHFYVALALRGMLDHSMDPPAAFEILDRLGDEVRQIRSPRALLSHEVMAPAHEDEVAQLLGLLSGFEVHIVITARDLARQIPSGWQQRIKQRVQQPYPEFAEAVLERSESAHDFWINQDVSDIAARWGHLVTPDRVHIVTVPATGAPTKVLFERFCGVIGIDPSSLDIDAARDNRSLGAPQTELLRRVNVALGDRLPHPRAGYGRVAKRHLANRVLAAQDGPALGLPVHLRDRCRAVSTGMVNRLRGQGYDVVGDLAELIPAPVDAPGSAGDAHSVGTDAEIAEAAVQALADMLEQRDRDLDRVQRLRSRLHSSPQGHGSM